MGHGHVTPRQVRDVTPRMPLNWARPYPTPNISEPTSCVTEMPFAWHQDEFAIVLKVIFATIGNDLVSAGKWAVITFHCRVEIARSGEATFTLCRADTLLDSYSQPIRASDES